MSACVLPPMLKQAGCRLVEEGRTLIVLDPDGVELERGSRSSWGWLCAASAGMLIERWSEALGLCHELHLKQLKMRFWCPGDDPETAPWRPFAAALAWLAEVAAARAAQAAQRLAAQAQRWVAWFVPLLGVLVQGVSRLRVQARRQAVRFAQPAGVLGQVERELLASWAWTAGRGPPGQVVDWRAGRAETVSHLTWRMPWRTCRETQRG